MGTVSMRGLRDVQGPQCEMMGQKIPSGTLGPLRRHTGTRSPIVSCRRWGTGEHSGCCQRDSPPCSGHCPSRPPCIHSPMPLSCNTPVTSLLSALNSPLVPSG